MKIHDCISLERKKIMEESPNVIYVRFDISTIKNMATKEEQDEKTGQRIWVGYTHVKKDGTQVKKEYKSFVTHVFCPFCGEKYK